MKNKISEKKYLAIEFPHYNRWITILSIIILTLILGGCNDSSNGDSDGDSSEDTLKVTVLDDPLTSNPLIGAFVSLYNSDKQTISKTIKTGSDGIANFGNVSASLTLTIAYEDNGEEAREIRTIYDAQPGNYTIYMKDVGCSSQDTINATYSGIGGDALAASLEPHLSGDGALLTSHSTAVTGGVASFSNVPVCLDDIQSDGKLTHFTVAIDGDGAVSSYGFEADQTINNGANYTGSADLTPTMLNWSAASADDKPDGIVLSAVHKAVAYSNLGFGPLPTDSSGATSGEFPVADQFPADAFIVEAVQSEGLDNDKITIRRYDSYPTSISVDFTDNEFTTFTYDSTTESFSWTLTGNSTKDFIQVSSEFNASIDVNWSLTMSPDTTTVTLPTLPGDVQAWFDRTNIDADDTDVLAGDVQSTNSYNEYLILAAKTADLVSQSVTVDADVVFRELDSVNDNGTNNGGGDTLYGTLTFSGTGLTSFPSANYEPTTVSSISGVTAWGDGTVVLSVQSFAPLDASKAASVTLSKSDGSSDTWGATPAGLNGVPGVSVSTSSSEITFTNAVVTSQTAGTSITLNGTLSY